MPGSVLLLLLVSLLILATGSDARRIRKRGLNHKVRLAFFFFSFPFYRDKVFTVQHCCRQLPSRHEGSFVAEVRGHQVDPGQPPGCKLEPFSLTVLFNGAVHLVPRDLFLPSCSTTVLTASFDFTSAFKAKAHKFVHAKQRI